MSLLRALPSPFLGEVTSSKNQPDETPGVLLDQVKGALTAVGNSALQTYHRHQTSILGNEIARTENQVSGLARNIRGLQSLIKNLAADQGILARKTQGLEITRAAFPRLTERVSARFSTLSRSISQKSSEFARVIVEQEAQVARLNQGIAALKVEQAKWSPSKAMTRGVGLSVAIGSALTIYDNAQRVKRGEISRQEAITDDAVTITGVYLPSALLASAAQGLYYAKIGSRAGLKGALIGFAIGFGVELAAVYGFSGAKDYFESAGCRVTDVMVSALEFTLGYTDDEGVRHEPAVDAVVYGAEFILGYTDDEGIERGLFHDSVGVPDSVKNLARKMKADAFQE